MKRVLVVADHPSVIGAIRLALRHAAGFRVIATVDGRACVRAPLSESQPELVLIDEMCQRTDALLRVREAFEEVPRATIVLLSSGLGTAALDDAFELGAHAVISRRLHPATLGTLLREVAHGNVVHAPRRPRTDTRTADDELTARELEVFRLAQGRTNGRVADALFVSEQTIEFHLGNIHRKLGVPNRTQASRRAHLHALVDHDESMAPTSA